MTIPAPLVTPAHSQQVTNHYHIAYPAHAPRLTDPHYLAFEAFHKANQGTAVCYTGRLMRQHTVSGCRLRKVIPAQIPAAEHHVTIHCHAGYNAVLQRQSVKAVGTTLK